MPVRTFPQKRGAPPGNQNAAKHGVYGHQFTPQELIERAQWENDLISDMGHAPATGEISLISRASFLEMRLRRADKATVAGWQLADNVILSWINCQRILLTTLGLKRTQKQGPTLQDCLREQAQKANQGQTT